MLIDSCHFSMYTNNYSHFIFVFRFLGYEYLGGINSSSRNGDWEKYQSLFIYSSVKLNKNNMKWPCQQLLDYVYINNTGIFIINYVYTILQIFGKHEAMHAMQTYKPISGLNTL